MGKDIHTGDGNIFRLLPQTPKQQKFEPGDMSTEMAHEFDELRNLKPKRERMNPNERQRK